MKKSVTVALMLLSQACITDLGVDAPEPSEACDPDPRDRAVLLEVFPLCDLAMCGDLPEHQSRGRCVDDNQLGADQLALLAPCGGQTPSHCVPVELLVSDGLSQPPICASLGGAEGRCMSLCVPSVQEKRDQLPQDICADGNLCAPCFDPFTGESTGACDASICDAPVEPPYVFEACCAGKGGGLCIPREVVPDESEESLGEDSCTGTADDDVCVPAGFEADDFAPPACTNSLGIEGRCLPTCVPQVGGAVGSLFLQNDCPESFQRCVPCWANDQFCD
jgi:hypothetical protein